MMKLEDMKEFAALTDEERTTAIRREELRLEAVEHYDMEDFNPDSYSCETIDCGCGDPYFTLDKDGKENFNICFHGNGNIGSDMWDCIMIQNIKCLHCGSKPKAPQSYIDDYIAAEMEEVE